MANFELRAAARRLRQGLFSCALATGALACVTIVAPQASGGAVLAQAAAADAVPDTRLEELSITTSSGKHVFKVEVMRSQEQLSRGLMFRRNLAADRGMLFDFQEVKPVAMWMRNTYISLDMVFIDAQGLVVNVATNTEPLSEETITSARPVLSVLEVIAGTARRIGLKPGDLVVHKLFRNTR